MPEVVILERKENLKILYRYIDGMYGNITVRFEALNYCRIPL